LVSRVGLSWEAAGEHDGACTVRAGRGQRSGRLTVPRAEGRRNGRRTSCVRRHIGRRRARAVASCRLRGGRTSSGTVPSCSVRDRARSPVRAVHREFTARVRELSCGLHKVSDRKGRCSPRSERQLRSPPPGRRSGPAVSTLTCRRLASEGASATRPVAAAYVGSAPTCGADPCEKEHST
jgi:hypothetical protein